MRQVFLPRSLEHLWELLDREPESALYAGGTDFLVHMRSGKVNPSHLICLERIQELQGIRNDGSEIFIAAATTHATILDNLFIKTHFPVLNRAIAVLGSPPIRHMGTIGGNIVTASPAGDSLPALYALSAEVEVRSCSGPRRIALSDFIRGPGKVALSHGEIVSGIWLQKDADWTVQHYEKVGKRQAQACSVASLAALLRVEAGIVKRARLAWGSVGPTVVRSDKVDDYLAGKPLNLEVLQSMGEIIEEIVSPISDIRASADYRRMVSKSLVLRLSLYNQTK
ncbi:FAD binding domain-containing protein [Desulfomonile tiedjei]|uniref:Aerobic-type carbon monoxide dehydrogenase, middle subunit CoxM/CutM-like protein n=1 Tax=Desulfomonile tiedjei (strain ATCC 49306 / DSM 6799 / DCB-1) TaxID=706587 RepID=I4CCZ1_DESTA|nr:xanthine dehydrogenase family protein subunit M [Desulfomonile tiedjei]AFM27432.1 aerobic-type carbon monoxide dehydrogenase, middle subunit CoxM/CutM-like protein [Desulfomonile tiedjei DSM 6799]